MVSVISGPNGEITAMKIRSRCLATVTVAVDSRNATYAAACL